MTQVGGNVPLDPASVDVGFLAGFQAAYVQAGYSARRALAQFRGAGGHVGDAKWFRSYANVRAGLEGYDRGIALNPNTLPAPSDYNTIAMGNGGDYVTMVKVQMVDQDTGLWTTKDYMHKTSLPHTPGEAIQAAIDHYGSDTANDRYGQTVVGGYATGVYQTEPWVSGG